MLWWKKETKLFLFPFFLFKKKLHLKKKDMEAIEKVKEIINKGKKIKKEEKSFIREMYEKNGLPLEIENNRCVMCWISAAVKLYEFLTPEDEGSKCDWELKKGTDVMFNGIHICNAVLTNELAEKLVAMRFPEKYWARKAEKNESEN